MGRPPLGYTESTGHPLLRAEIAELYEHVAPDDVLVFAGAEEAIFCLSNVLLGPGDHAVVTWPGYQSLYEVGRAAGAEVTLHGFARRTAGASTSSGSSRPSPGDATRRRQRPPQPDRDAADPRRVGAARRRTGRPQHPSLADEVYRYLEFDEADRLLPGADAFPHGVSLGVMSKSFAMAGLRIGWLATRDRDLLGRCAAFKDYTTICSSAPSEILALIGLRAREQVLGRSLRIVADNLALLDAFFRRHADRFSVGAAARRLGRLPAAAR